MVGNIIEPINVSGGSGPVDPDDYFDPVTHVATEENFIKFLGCEVYDSKYIGYGVQLSNSVEYNDGVWIIADVDHDSANTGQSNCYDLISKDCFHGIEYSSSKYNSWRGGSIRNWLNNTFYTGFSSAFKARMLNPKYKSYNSWYDDDYIIIPSGAEVNGGTFTYQEGVPYPIFTGSAGQTADLSRTKYQSGTSSTGTWWLRTASPNMSYYFVVTGDGRLYYYQYNSYNFIAPLMRVQ